MIYKNCACALLWQLLASEHSGVLKLKINGPLHLTSPIISTQ
jgi:hypothetical protein